MYLGLIFWALFATCYCPDNGKGAQMLKAITASCIFWVLVNYFFHLLCVYCPP